MKVFLATLATVATLAFATDAALAQTAPAKSPANAPVALEPVVVTAARSWQPVLDTAATVDVVTAKDIQDNLATDIGQMVRYLPGISVPDDPTRFGEQGFTIRGIGGNRVLTLLDGVRVPDGFSIGSFSDAGRNFVDTSAIERVEIIRGPASALYGGDAVGGVVNILTKDPGDYLAGRDDHFYAGLDTGYATVNDGAMAGGTLAFGNPDNRGMLLFTRRQGHAFDNQGDVDTRDASRTRPNPQDYQSNNVLAKGVFTRGTNELTLELLANHADTDTDVFSSLSSTDYSADVGFPYVIANTGLTGHDTRDLRRLSARLDFGDGSASWFDTGTALAYYQHSETQQGTQQGQTVTMFGAPTDYAIQRQFDFRQKEAGATLTLRKHLRGKVDQQLVYGAEIRQTRVEELRDGSEVNLATGAVSKSVTPDNFPVRDFPNSTIWDAGVYVEDRIGFADGRFLLIPGMRYDHHQLDAQNDVIFATANPGVDPVDKSGGDWSPRLGVVYKFTDHTSMFAQYAYGYRAPSYADVNVGFTNLQFGYTAIPNPNLKPETSHSVELGIRHYGRRGNFTVGVYHDRFKDFIEPFVPLGVDPQTGLLTYQARNLGKVTIYGLEAHGALGLDFVLPGLQLQGAMAWGVGNDDTAGEPLNSVDPPKLTLGLAYLAPDGRWKLRLMGNFVHAKDRVNDDTDAGVLFRTPGYATFDLIGNVKLTRDTELDVGLFNLTDRKYWTWAGVNGRAANDAAIDRYTQAGFHAGISLHMHW